MNRRGAYAETCQAIERAHSAGLSVGCNVFLTIESLPQLDELIAAMGSLVDAGKCFETASYLPTPRSRRNERLRVTLPNWRRSRPASRNWPTPSTNACGPAWKAAPKPPTSSRP